MKIKSKTIRIDVSIGVHKRLLKFGLTFPQRVNNLLSCREVVHTPVIRPLGKRRGIHVTLAAHKSLLIAQESLGCPSLSNVIESMLNTEPNIPFKTQLTTAEENEPVIANIRIKKSDHTRISDMAEKEGVPMWLMVHYLVEAFNDTSD